MCTREDLREELEEQLGDLASALRQELRALGAKLQAEVQQIPRDDAAKVVKPSAGRPQSGGLRLQRSSSTYSALLVPEIERPMQSKEDPQAVGVVAAPEVVRATSSDDVDAEYFFSRYRRGYMAGKELPQAADHARVHATMSEAMRPGPTMHGGDMSPADTAQDTATMEEIAEEVGQPDGAGKVFAEGRVHERVRRIVASPLFDFATMSMILLNAAILGIQTDVMARALTQEEPLAFTIFERIFCVIFTGELAMRIYVYQCRFFARENWAWNSFDVVIVALQLVDVMVELILGVDAGRLGPPSENDWRSNISIVRMLRILRLVRILRVLRTLRSVSELRTIIVSIFGTLRTLVWTLLLLFLVIFMVAVTITQVVTQHCLFEPDADKRAELQKYYGNLGASILVLFQAITNGLDWQNMLVPLMNYISPWLVLPICTYIGFGVFALMNIVTGVFVESALESARKEKERFLLHTVRELFRCTDEDESGDISWTEFRAHLDHPAMHLYFKTIDLDIEEAEDLFRLIDIDGSGSVDPEEFVNGCIRLQGPAKALDLATLMHEFKRAQKWNAQRHRSLSAALAPLRQPVSAAAFV